MGELPGLQSCEEALGQGGAGDDCLWGPGAAPRQVPSFARKIAVHLSSQLCRPKLLHSMSARPTAKMEEPTPVSSFSADCAGSCAEGSAAPSDTAGTASALKNSSNLGRFNQQSVAMAQGAGRGRDIWRCRDLLQCLWRAAAGNECRAPAAGRPAATPAAATRRRVASCRSTTGCTLAPCSRMHRRKMLMCLRSLADHPAIRFDVVSNCGCSSTPAACCLAAIEYAHEKRRGVLGPMAERVLRLQVPDSKCCPGCGTWLPADSFYHCASNLDGLTSQCIECHQFHVRKHGRRRAACPAPVLPAAKRCGGPCGRVLPLAAFTKQPASADRHSYMRKQCYSMKCHQQASQALSDKQAASPSLPSHHDADHGYWS